MNDFSFERKKTNLPVIIVVHIGRFLFTLVSKIFFALETFPDFTKNQLRKFSIEIFCRNDVLYKRIHRYRIKSF
jgi:hypothetical protein